MKHDNFIKNLGRAVQFFRQKNNLTQEQLAVKIDKSEDTVSYIERGKISAKLDTLLDICKIFDISIIDLFQFETISHTTKPKAEYINEILKIMADLTEEEVHIYKNIITEVIKFKK
jgi:DNA-binding XRE family transcriptional regulator